MKILVTQKEMQMLDENTTEFFHVPSIVLMEKAALLAVQEIENRITKFDKILITCGCGNNGADGIAIARMLSQKQYDVTIQILGTKKEDGSLFSTQLEIYRAYGYKEYENESISEFTVIIDAIFGVGLSREITGEYFEWIDTYNQTKALKIAIDIPSGVDATSGQIHKIAFVSDLTVTFGFDKVGLHLWPGDECVGEVVLCDIGITNESWMDKKPSVYSLEKKDLDFLPVRKPHSNKGTYGTLLVFAGGTHMAGAAVFVAKAAYRMGCGIVKVITSKSNKAEILSNVPEAVLCTYEKSYQEIDIKSELDKADGIVIGPGLGVDEEAKNLLEFVLKNRGHVPCVLDADALNMIAKDDMILPEKKEDRDGIIMTPHLGEMSRLTNDAVSFLQTHLIKSAKEYADEQEVVLVLKDYHSVIAYPYEEAFLNLSGCNGMATAGSGDVLSGIMGSLLAQGLDAKQAAALGVYVHGMAGEHANKKMNNASIMASDIIEGLKEI